MYYTKEEIEIAIDKASKAISDKSKEVTKFTYGYNDCFALLVEYDKALRGKENTKLNEFFKTFGAYKNPKEWLSNMNRVGFDNYKDLAIHSGYEPARKKKPRFGDIGYELLKENVGMAMVAGNNFWVSSCPLNNGIQTSRRIVFYERRLLFLGTPLRS